MCACALPLVCVLLRAAAACWSPRFLRPVHRGPVRLARAGHARLQRRRILRAKRKVLAGRNHDPPDKGVFGRNARGRRTARGEIRAAAAMEWQSAPAAAAAAARLIASGGWATRTHSGLLSRSNPHCLLLSLIQPVDVFDIISENSEATVAGGAVVLSSCGSVRIDATTWVNSTCTHGGRPAETTRAQGRGTSNAAQHSTAQRPPDAVPRPSRNAPISVMGLTDFWSAPRSAARIAPNIFCCESDFCFQTAVRFGATRRCRVEL